MAKDVAVIGVGQSSFVRGYEGSIRELAFEAFREAMQDAGITQKDVELPFSARPRNMTSRGRLQACLQSIWA